MFLFNSNLRKTCSGAASLLHIPLEQSIQEEEQCSTPQCLKLNPYQKQFEKKDFHIIPSMYYESCFY